MENNKINFTCSIGTGNLEIQGCELNNKVISLRDILNSFDKDATYKYNEDDILFGDVYQIRFDVFRKRIVDKSELQLK